MTAQQQHCSHIVISLTLPSPALLNLPACVTESELHREAGPGHLFPSGMNIGRNL